MATVTVPNRRDKPRWLASAIVLMIAIGAADSQTNPNITFTLFYTLPAAIAAWCCSRTVSWLLALASTLVWVAIDFEKGRVDLELFAYVWNFGSRLALLVAFAAILSALRDALEREHELGRRDFVTQVFNARAFYELAALEIRRSRRHNRPLTLIYTDVDNFKAVNDARGHEAGDQVLRTVASTMRENIRVNDFIGRLGGDEFAILLPDTSREGAEAVVAKLRQNLTAGVGGNGWPITFSMGVVSCVPSSEASADLIKDADELMYQVKGTGKDAARFSAETETRETVQS